LRHQSWNAEFAKTAMQEKVLMVSALFAAFAFL